MVGGEKIENKTWCPFRKKGLAFSFLDTGKYFIRVITFVWPRQRCRKIWNDERYISRLLRLQINGKKEILHLCITADTLHSWTEEGILMCKTLHVISLLFFWDLPKLCSHQEPDIFAQKWPWKSEETRETGLNFSFFLFKTLSPYLATNMTSHMFYQVFFKAPTDDDSV